MNGQNKELVENKEIEKGLTLPIMESFYSIQGEGFYSGKAAYFIRTAGCDVGCHFCDVKESWDKDLHPLKSIYKIVEDILSHNAKTVIITGGEPLMWNLKPLTKLLNNSGINVNIETSGAYPITGSFDWICVSPKKGKKAITEILTIANELKIIIYSKNDFKWAEKYAQKVSSKCILFLQPEWNKFERMTPLIVNYIKENPKWNISLQVHKYMKIP